MPNLTDAEQYLVELINRARLDPQAEAERQGIALNQGLNAGTIGRDSLQVLSVNDALTAAAEVQSEWVLESDTFGHTGEGGSTAAERIREAGYTNSSTTGENLSMRLAYPNAVDLEAAIDLHFNDLYASASHRAGTFNANFAEVGISQIAGRYTGPDSAGNTYDWQASMVTETFGARRGTVSITGVAYADADSDNFYSMGEGRGGVWVSAGGTRETTASSGGYSIDLTPDDSVRVSFGSGGSRWGIVNLDLSDGNAKLDIVGTSASNYTLQLSASTVLGAGVRRADLLGNNDLSLRGNGRANNLDGNDGNNVIRGRGGNDIIEGGSGNDRLYGDRGVDTLDGGAGRDRLVGGSGGDILTGGSGADRLYGQSGDDILSGGGGRDRFIFNDGDDTITDFQNNIDTIYLSRSGLGLRGASVADVIDMAQVTGEGVIISFDNGDSLTIHNLRSAIALSDDIEFI